MFTSDPNNLAVEWYHEDNLIDVTSDPRYSVIRESTSLYILKVARVEAVLLGRYQVVVTVMGKNESDTVELAFPGKYMYWSKYSSSGNITVVLGSCTATSKCMFTLVTSLVALMTSSWWFRLLSAKICCKTVGSLSEVKASICF